MADKSSTINCASHGQSITATVCGHLIKNNGNSLGFIENSSEPDDLQGWCYACEYLFLQENDKTEKFMKFCDFAVVCSKCYAQLKAAHDINP